MYGKERESDLSFPSAPRKALSLTRRQESLCTFDSSAKRGSVFVSGRIKAPNQITVPFPLCTVCTVYEQEKRRKYDQRVREVEHATFTPLVLSTSGGMRRAATTFYRRFTSMIAEKRDMPYSNALNWIRCRLSFALLRASIMSIRGARSSRFHPATDFPIDLQLPEGHLN